MTPRAALRVAEVLKPKNLSDAWLVISVPLGFKRRLIHLVHPEERQRVANGMRWARLPDLQHCRQRLVGELSDEFEFGVGKGRHGLILILNKMDHICP